MKIRFVSGALVVGCLLMFAPTLSISTAQSKDAGASASNAEKTSARMQKYRHWRHRGGRHPHYGSRRVRH
jgi:hypothetical protein